MTSWPSMKSICTFFTWRASVAGYGIGALCAALVLYAGAPAAAQSPSLPKAVFGFELGTVLDQSLRRGCDLGEWCAVLPRQRQPEFDRYSVRITPSQGRIYRIAATRFVDDLHTCKAQARDLMAMLERNHGIRFETVAPERVAPLVRAAWRWALTPPPDWQVEYDTAYEIDIRCKGPAVGVNAGGAGRSVPAATLKVFFNDFRLLQQEQPDKP